MEANQDETGRDKAVSTGVSRLLTLVSCTLLLVGVVAVQWLASDAAPPMLTTPGPEAGVDQATATPSERTVRKPAEAPPRLLMPQQDSVGYAPSGVDDGDASTPWRDLDGRAPQTARRPLGSRYR
ncbi:MAG: hypothetical protein AAF589_03655 [Planctomycetota bacterium]